MKRPFEFSATSCFVRFSTGFRSRDRQLFYDKIFACYSSSLNFVLVLIVFLFLTVGHGKQFNSKEAEPSNNMELSSVQVFAYLTRTRGNKGKKSSCLAGYLIYQIIKFRL